MSRLILSPIVALSQKPCVHGQKLSVLLDQSALQCGGVFEQLARNAKRYRESDLHLAFILLNLLTTYTYSATFSVPPTSLLLLDFSYFFITY